MCNQLPIQVCGVSEERGGEKCSAFSVFVRKSPFFLFTRSRRTLRRGVSFCSRWETVESAVVLSWMDPMCSM